MVDESLTEGLRERKKRLMRQLISDTATGMFLERGFDEVKVTDVAEAAGVSEKTVYNYFPTKESLLLDREESMATAIRQALGPGAPSRSPIAAALDVLAQDRQDLRYRAGEMVAGDLTLLHRFRDLIDKTPSLRSAQHDMMDRLVQVAAEAMAARAGVSPDDPEPQIAADAILGLWRVQYNALRKYADGTTSPDQLLAKVSEDVRRAARLIDSGLWAFEVMVQGPGGREQLRAAAEAAQTAGRQVAAALRQAKAAWRESQMSGHDARAAWRESLGPNQDPRATRAAMQEARRDAQRQAHSARHQQARAARGQRSPGRPPSA